MEVYGKNSSKALPRLVWFPRLVVSGLLLLTRYNTATPWLLGMMLGFERL